MIHVKGGPSKAVYETQVNMPDSRLQSLLDLVKAMDENWTMIAVAMRISADPRYLDAFTKIDGAFRVAKAAAERNGE